jgi:hypothetical protein
MASAPIPRGSKLLIVSGRLHCGRLQIVVTDSRHLRSRSISDEEPTIPPMAELKKALIERLFSQHRNALQAFFYRRVRTKPEVPDLVQEVYLRMLRVKDIDAIHNPEGYLYTVASNLLTEHAVLDRRQAAATDLDQPGHPGRAVPERGIRGVAGYAGPCAAPA